MWTGCKTKLPQEQSLAAHTVTHLDCAAAKNKWAAGRTELGQVAGELAAVRMVSAKQEDWAAEHMLSEARQPAAGRMEAAGRRTAVQQKSHQTEFVLAESPGAARTTSAVPVARRMRAGPAELAVDRR